MSSLAFMHTDDLPGIDGYLELLCLGPYWTLLFIGYHGLFGMEYHMESMSPLTAFSNCECFFHHVGIGGVERLVRGSPSICTVHVNHFLEPFLMAIFPVRTERGASCHVSVQLP
jgi:hypothetical protein